MELHTSSVPFPPAFYLAPNHFAPDHGGHAIDSPLGLDDLVSQSPLLRSAAGTPIELNGLRLHCDGGAPHLSVTRQDASGKRLASLAQTLSAPFVSHDDYVLELSDIETAITPPGSRTEKTAHALVQCAYGMRYRGSANRAIKELNDAQTRGASTVVAIAPQRGGPQVLGTLRFDVGQRLSVLDFFTPGPASNRPDTGAAFAEYSGLAFHPVFDQIGRSAGALQRDLTRFYKLLVLRKMVARCTTESLQHGARALYFIAARPIARFLTTGGLRLEPLSGGLPAQSAFPQRMREALPRYWRPGQTEQQPILYALSTELDEIKVRIGMHHVVIDPDNSLRLGADHSRTASA
jgi:hypothetical protein